MKNNEYHIYQETQETQEADNNTRGKKYSPYLVPGAILTAGIFVAAAVFFSGGGGSAGTANMAGQNQNGGQQEAQKPAEVRSVTSGDYIRGSEDAPVKIIEYSDFSCPYCQSFHPTVQRAVEEYGGEVAWVYRHFPLATIHSHAQKQAEAAECVGAEAGNDAFWAYTDLLFEKQTVPTSQLAGLASQVGVSSSAVQECMNAGTYADAVQEDFDEAVANGGRGTPYTVVVAANGKTFPVSGAQPYNVLKSAIDSALQEN